MIKSVGISETFVIIGSEKRFPFNYNERVTCCALFVLTRFVRLSVRAPPPTARLHCIIK